MQAHFQLNDLESALVFNGAFIAGTLSALYLQFREGKTRGYPVGTWITVIAVINGLLVVGSRLGGFSMADWATLLGKGIFPPHAEKTVMGGLLLAIPVYFIVKRWWKLPAGAIDVIVLGLPLAAFFCRIGCLFTGCCFGELTHGGWGLCYASGTPAYAWQLSRGLIQPGAAASLPVHPVQLYFILSNCLTFCILYVNRDRFRRAGSLALAGLCLLMLFRFGHEFFREATTNRGEFGLILLGLKAVQWVCLAIGIGSLVALYIREKQKKWGIGNLMDFSGASLVHESVLILFAALMSWTLRHQLSSVEYLVLLISFLPALAGVLKRLFSMGWINGRILSPYAMITLSLIFIADISADTLVPMQNTMIPGPAAKSPKKWLEFGTGGTIGDWGHVTRDCDGNIVSIDPIKNKSLAAEVSLHNYDKNDNEIVIGQRFFGGRISMKDNSIYGIYNETLDYFGMGTYVRMENKWVGLGLGLYYYPYYKIENAPEWGSTIDESVVKMGSTVPMASLRIGKRSGYFVDATLYDNHLFNFFPQPTGSLGLINWGFKDPSGNSNLRLGIVYMQDELGYTMSGKVPITNTGFTLGGGFYFQHGFLFSGGLYYRLPLK